MAKFFLYDGSYTFEYSKLHDCEKILVVGGDSWSNVLNTSERNWVRIFGINKQYDAVIVCANFGDSNRMIFRNLVSLLSYSDQQNWQNIKHESWLNKYELKNKTVHVIVEWSSIIRDFSEDTAWYRPFTWASQPDWKLIDKDIYEEYFNHIFHEKIYSYKTQLYSWQLQKYFEKWNIPYYFWMGFCNLVPESAKDTDLDLRKFLNKEHWFNLYESPNNMLDYFYYLEKNTIPESTPTIFTEGSVIGFEKGIDIIKNFYNKIKNNTALRSGTYLSNDLHPNAQGHAKIAEVLIERTNKLF